MKSILFFFSLLMVTSIATGDEQTEAISDYETWLTDNGPNLSVLYNLGNAYYKNEDYGNAILAYEKALALKPTDRKTKTNLRLAREAVGMENRSVNRYGILGAISYNGWTKQLVFSSFLILLTFILPTLKRMEIHKKPIKIVRFIAITILILAIAALILRKPELNRAIVVAKDAKIRISPFATADSVSPLELGEMIQVQDLHKDFYQVEKGWVSSSEVKKIYD